MEHAEWQEEEPNRTSHCQVNVGDCKRCRLAKTQKRTVHPSWFDTLFCMSRMEVGSARIDTIPHGYIKLLVCVEFMLCARVYFNFQ